MSHATPCRCRLIASGLGALASLLLVPANLNAESLDSLVAQFRWQSGAELVFDRGALPHGTYFDVLVPLSEPQRSDVARLLLTEVEKYPRGFLGETGMSTVGVFAACISKRGDGFRKFDPALKGYRYFGIYNGSNALVAAFYSEQQVRLTFHHELFHHVDATVKGVTEAWRLSSDDAQFRAAVSGLRPYPGLQVNHDDLDALSQLGSGKTLRGAVSAYASKSPREDQAETARHLMTQLPDSLLQAARRPDLPGSQRLIHVMREYRAASDLGLDHGWLVDTALSRTPVTAGRRLLSELQSLKVELSDKERLDDGLSKRIRDRLSEAAQLSWVDIPASLRRDLVEEGSQLTSALMLRRVHPDGDNQRFTVWGKEDGQGANWTLRSDLEAFGQDAISLRAMAGTNATFLRIAEPSLRKNLETIGRYERYIELHWTLSEGTHEAFLKVKTELTRR